MAIKRVGILLPVLGIYGGINIIVNWAAILAKAGYYWCFAKWSPLALK